LANKILASDTITKISTLPDILERKARASGVLGHFPERRIGPAVRDDLVVMCYRQGGALSVVVKEAALAATMLADDVAEVVGLGHKLGHRGISAV
jgi:hypothetical protein